LPTRVIASSDRGEPKRVTALGGYEFTSDRPRHGQGEIASFGLVSPARLR
jgi:hypothetical protein